MATGLTLNGTSGNDTLVGGNDDDTINGLGGDDSITTGTGADVVNGGDGNDRIAVASYGTVDGGAGDDLIELTGGRVVRGGTGNDTITGASSSYVQAFGDDGDDVISVGMNSTLDGGAGNDILTVYDGTVTGGAGQDRITISNLYNRVSGTVEDPWSVTITDFTSGSNGDILDLSKILPQLVGYTGGDPFGRWLWLEQLVGGTTLVRLDRDQAGGTYGTETVAILQNTFVNDLTSANFAGGMVPTKDRITTDSTQTGSTGNDTLGGGWGNDTIDGGAGNDTIVDVSGSNNLIGGAGDDSLYGGSGNDSLTGGSGNDTLKGDAGHDSLYGGSGNDSLEGGTGNDLLLGGDGDDLLSDFSGNNTLEGGDGNDSISGGGGINSLYGGNGDDTLTGYWGTLELDGGAGNDILTIRDNFGAQATLRGGDGNDVLTSEVTSASYNVGLYGDAGDDVLSGDGAILDGGIGNDRFAVAAGTVTGGAGADTISLNGVKFTPSKYGDFNSVSTTTITDFNPTEGDKIDLASSIASMRSYQGGNPFGTQMWLKQDGNDTLLMVDPDLTMGSVNNVAPTALARLQNVQASSLTANAFVQGFTPALSSTYEQVTLVGGAGNDTLIGKLSHDSLSGGDGSDLLYGNLGSDKLNGGNGIDAARYTTALGQGVTIQTVMGSNLPSYITSTEGSDQLSGVEIGIFNNKVVPLIAPQKWSYFQPYDHAEFDNATYLSIYPDIAAAVAAGVFKTGEDHYLAFGRKEGRASPAVENGTAVLFDTNFYLLTNPDVDLAIRSGILPDAWTHYKLYGAKEGRDPNILFDTDWYLASNPDVATAVANGSIDALTHFAKYGWKEGRDPSRWFDTSAYLTSNPDVAAVQGLNPLLHFLSYGYHEGRTLTFTELI